MGWGFRRSKKAAVTDQNEVRFWEAAIGRDLATLYVHYSRVLTLAFHPDGTQLATGGEDGTAKGWGVPEEIILVPVPLSPQPSLSQADINQIVFFCTMCHAINTPDNGIWSSLTGIASRAGSTVEGMSAEEYISQSLSDPRAYMIPGYDVVMPSYAESQLYSEMGPEFLETVVSYLLTLK